MVSAYFDVLQWSWYHNRGVGPWAHFPTRSQCTLHTGSPSVHMHFHHGMLGVLGEGARLDSICVLFHDCLKSILCLFVFVYRTLITNEWPVVGGTTLQGPPRPHGNMSTAFTTLPCCSTLCGISHRFCCLLSCLVASYCDELLLVASGEDFTLYA